jgi:hypothetical protein
MNKLAGRDVYFHGTSSAFLTPILSQGLLPESGESIYENYETSGGRSLSSYGGVYLTTNYMTAESSSTNATKKYSGNSVIIVVTYETRTPGTMLDEDHFMVKVERYLGRTYNSLFEWSNPLANQIHGIGLEYYVFSYFKEHQEDKEYLQKILTSLEKLKNNFDSFDFSLISKEILEELAQKRPKLNKRLELQETEILTLLNEVLKNYVYHLTELYLKEIPNFPVPSYFNGTLNMLKESTNVFMRKLPELAYKEKGETYMHNVRVTEPIGYSGANRILCVVEEVEKKSVKKVISDFYPEGSNKSYYDLYVHHGLDSINLYLAPFTERMGYPYRLISPSGVILGHGTGSSDAWSPVGEPLNQVEYEKYVQPK